MFKLNPKKRPGNQGPTLELSPPLSHMAIPKASHYVLTAAATHIGTRPYQEDAVYVTESIRCGPDEKAVSFGILCDGMGGMANGDVASSETVTYLANRLANLEVQADVPRFLEAQVQNINRLVYAMGAEGKTQGAAGTTLTAAVIVSNRLYWVSVGDSRMYIIRQGEMVQVTQEHNYSLTLQAQVEKGIISLEAAIKDPQKDALISFIGLPVLELMDLNRNPFLLEPGDMVLLCSDGLNKALTDEEILATILACADDITEAARCLPLTAFDKNFANQDNTSVVLMQYQMQQENDNM